MSDKLSNSTAKKFIEKEGIGYAVMHYIEAEHFADEKTRELWENAKKACEQLQAYVNLKADEEEMEGIE